VLCCVAVMLPACSNLRMCQLSPQEACSFLAAQQSSPLFSALVSHLASGPVVAMELMAASGVRKLLDILGEPGDK
jgi:nucleoside diphosphate kinase